MLFRKCEPINQEETFGRNSQELASSCLKSDDEVQNDGIHGEGCESDRDVDESHGGSFDKRMIHGCLLMAEDQGTMSEQGGNFSHGAQSGEQNSAEKTQRQEASS